MKKYFCSMRIFTKAIIVGIVIGVLPMVLISLLLNLAPGYFFENHNLVLSLLIMILTALVICVATIVADWLNAILDKLSLAQKYFRNGEFSYRISIENDFDMNRVYSGFNIMADITQESIEKSMENVEAKAIAQTTQMLAHDVRKPFSMLQGVLSMISRAESLQEVRSISQDSIPEIERGINSVNGMIQDVMEVGARGKINPEEVNPETLIESTLKDSLRYIEEAQIGLSYEFNHDMKVNVDLLKTSRVFANIISNGAQAMKYKGKMWFKTKATQEGFIQFTIGNSNSYIPPEKIEKLFEAFFTSSKKGGTGLGLAIAKKVVGSHGGVIWCTSSESEGTEFHFTLPTSESLSDYTGELPVSTDKILQGFTREAEASPPSKDIEDANERTLEKGIIHELQVKHRKISVLLVDDEKLYTTVLKNQLTCNDSLVKHLSVIETSSGEDALMSAIQENFDIVVLDVDMGKDKLNGFDTAAKMRKIGFNGTICIHSNRSGPEYYKKAMAYGADLFIGKTMPREHFLRLIYSVIGDPHKLLNSDSQKATATKSRIVVVEDNKIFRKAWENVSHDTEISTYDCPDALLEELASDPGALDDADAIVIDNNYGNLSDMTGFDLARSLKSKGIRITKAIATGEHLTDDDVRGAFDVIVPKNPEDGLNTLKEYLSK